MSLSIMEMNLKPVRMMLAVIALLWGLLLMSHILPINELGIRPRALAGLPGILLAPFLHANFSHLVANSLSLLVLGSLFITLEKGRAVYAVISMIVLGGIGTWIIGRSGTVHIGASGVVYGLMGFLLSIGVFKRTLKTILLSIFVLLLYSGAVWGILPMAPFISWESHLSGFIAGVAVARAEAKGV